MYSLRSIGILSCAKMMGAVYGCIALVLMPFFLLFGLAGMLTGGKSGALSGAVMLLMAILLPVFYAAMGFIFGALTAWIYNLVAGWIGGVELELRLPVQAPASLPAQV